MQHLGCGWPVDAAGEQTRRSSDAGHTASSKQGCSAASMQESEHAAADLLKMP
jgi:hypothetical protein